MDLDAVADTLQKSVVMLMQAWNAVSYQQRLESWKSYVDPKATKGIIHDNAKILEKSKTHLFGTGFKSVLKASSKEAEQALAYFDKKSQQKIGKDRQQALST